MSFNVRRHSVLTPHSVQAGLPHEKPLPPDLQGRQVPQRNADKKSTQTAGRQASLPAMPMPMPMPPNPQAYLAPPLQQTMQTMPTIPMPDHRDYLPQRFVPQPVVQQQATGHAPPVPSRETKPGYRKAAKALPPPVPSRETKPGHRKAAKALPPPVPSRSTDGYHKVTGSSRPHKITSETVYTTRSGVAFPSVLTLPHAQREAFLNRNDPVRRLELNDDSVFYRGMPSEFVVNGRISGNPDSMARISNHQAVMPDPFLAKAPLDVLQQLVGKVDLMVPREMRASDLPEHSLNVAFGRAAKDVAQKYGKSGIVVKMRLGDLRAAGGGMVFDDVSAVLNNPGRVSPLIVTLPQGKTIPVEIV